MQFRQSTKLFSYLVLLALMMNGCKKVEEILPPAVKNIEVEFFFLVDGRKLVKYDMEKPSVQGTPMALSGLESGEIILAIDFRPATGQLYALGSTSRLYVVNTLNGQLKAVGTAPFSPVLTGNLSGFDFNPTVDRIRVVTNSGQNLRLNPETGTVAATDLPINGPAGASVTSVAYTNNVAGAASTVLYDIDVNSDKLFKQDPPNNGTLVEVGSLGVNFTGEGGFDIAPDNSVALAVYNNFIYYINLENGKATKIGGLGNHTNITGIAIRTEPVAYATDEMNNLLIFNPMKPVPVTKPITGLAAGERIEGIDFRPLNGQLYALSSASRLYTINASSGAAVAVGTMPFNTLLSGTAFGFDFNPTVDRIRVVSNMGQNLRLNPENGAVAAVDGVINPAGSAVTAVAYTNNFSGATTTLLYDIDAATDKLFKQDPPNNGTLVEVGPLGVNVEQTAGFDIGGTSGKAYALLTVGGTTKIYTVNLTNGSVSPMGTFPKAVTGFAVGLGF